MVSLLAIVSYYLGLHRVFYWLNRKAKRIITFHNVLPDELYSATMEGLGCVEKLSDFEYKIGEIAQRFTFSTDLADPRSATLTFDDGTLNEYEVAGEALKKRGIPAVLFVAGDIKNASSEEALVTDKIIIWCYLAPEEAVEKVFSVHGLSRDELWERYVQPGYRADSKTRGRDFLARLEKACTVESICSMLPKEWVRLRLSGVSEAQLDDLRARGWKIGWHTWSHYPLGMLDDEAKRQELDSPLEYRNVVLSYPYGDIGAIGEASLKIAQELEYPCAVSNDPYYSPHRGRFFLRRTALLSKNKYLIHFELSGLRYFLQHRKLLPRV